jgi:hypothetical protein
MNGAPIPQKLADGSVVLTWIAWFLSHIDQINAVVQFFALLLAIVASICAIRYHWKKAE